MRVTRYVLATALALYVLVVPGPVLSQEPKAKDEKKDAFDKAGAKTESAMEKAGDATEKGLDAAGKGIGAAVEHSGRGVAEGSKAAAKGVAKAGSAVAGVFSGDQEENNKILAAQRSLQAEGYYSGPLDGIIGPKTRSGLREFQQDQELQATGKLDDDTAKRLGLR